jgi:hypothetical protein
MKTFINKMPTLKNQPVNKPIDKWDILKWTAGGNKALCREENENIKRKIDEQFNKNKK